MTSADSLKRARVLALVVPAALLGGAYIAQYGFDLYPCQMCWWQRYPHFAAVALAALAWIMPAKARMLVGLAGLALLVSGLIGAFHAGVEYHWWEGITSCATTAATGGDPLEAILNAPIVRCDVAPWSLWSISLAGWNFLASTAGALAVFQLLRRARP